MSMEDVNGAFESFCTVAQSMGIKTDNWVIQEGSATYGRAYRMYRKGDKGGLYSILGGDGYLGMTKPEVYQTLQTMLNTLHLVNEHNR